MSRGRFSHFPWRPRTCSVAGVPRECHATDAAVLVTTPVERYSDVSRPNSLALATDRIRMIGTTRAWTIRRTDVTRLY